MSTIVLQSPLCLTSYITLHTTGGLADLGNLQTAREAAEAAARAVQEAEEAAELAAELIAAADRFDRATPTKDPSVSG